MGSSFGTDDLGLGSLELMASGPAFADRQVPVAAGALRSCTRTLPEAAGHAGVVELGFFDEVAEAVRGLVGADRMDMRHQARRWGLKAWFGAERPTREHYEAQLIAPDGVDGAAVSALEIGFHAEHPDAADNEATIARLVAGQDRWRAVLGDDAVVGSFLGRFPDWRRVSEAWPDPDLDDPDLPVHVALRLTDYIDALEPLRRGD